MEFEEHSAPDVDLLTLACEAGEDGLAKFRALLKGIYLGHLYYDDSGGLIENMLDLLIGREINIVRLFELVRGNPAMLNWFRELISVNRRYDDLSSDLTNLKNNFHSLSEDAAADRETDSSM